MTRTLVRQSGFAMIALFGTVMLTLVTTGPVNQFGLPVIAHWIA